MTDELLGFESQEAPAGRRGVQVDPLGVVPRDHVGGVLGQKAVHGFAVAQLPHQPLAVADVAYGGRDEQALLGLDGTEADLHRKLVAVPMTAGEVLYATHRPYVWVPLVSAALSDVLPTDPIGNQDLYALPDQLLAPVAEELLGLGVDRGDGTTPVGDDQGVGTRFHEQAKAFLGALAVRDVGDRTEHPRGLPGLAPDRLAAGVKPAVFAAPGAEPVVHGMGDATFQVVRDRGENEVVIFGVETRLERGESILHLRDLVAEHLLEARRKVDPARKHVPVPETGSRTPEGQVESFLAGVQRLHCCKVRDARGDDVGHGAQSVQGGSREFMAAEQGHHSLDAISADQRVPRECDHPLAPGPLLIAKTRVADDLVDQVGLAIPGDQADLELPHGYPAVRAVKVGVNPRAGLELEDVLSLV